MNATTRIKKLLVGIGFLAAASAPAALDLYPGAPDLLDLATQRMDVLLAASAERQTSAWWLVLAALGVMAVVVKRRSKI